MHRRIKATLGDNGISLTPLMLVQVPNGGQPILLMADHQTAGGYPVVATVVSAALPIAAQLLPGDELHFVEITLGRAQEMRKALTVALDTLRGAPAH